MSATPNKVSEFKKAIDSGLVTGLVLPPRTKWFRSKVERTRFKSVDFNGPLFGGFLSAPTFIECEFAECDFSGLNTRKTSFVNCKFQKTSFDGNYGYIRSGKFEDCEFVECAFGGMEFSGVEFTNVSCLDCKFISVNFAECNMTSLVIRGLIKSVNFIDCRCQGVDVSDSELIDTSLFAGEPVGLKLPNNDRNFLLSPGSFQSAKSVLKDTLSQDAFQVYCEAADYYSGSGHSELVDQAMFSDNKPDDVTKIMQVLRDNRSR